MGKYLVSLLLILIIGCTEGQKTNPNIESNSNKDNAIDSSHSKPTFDYKSFRSLYLLTLTAKDSANNETFLGYEWGMSLEELGLHSSKLVNDGTLKVINDTPQRVVYYMDLDIKSFYSMELNLKANFHKDKLYEILLIGKLPQKDARIIMNKLNSIYSLKYGKSLIYSDNSYVYLKGKTQIRIAYDVQSGDLIIVYDDLLVWSKLNGVQKTIKEI